MKENFMNIVNKINNMDSFSLSMYYDYIKKYGKDTMLKVFKKIFFINNGKSLVLDKYLNVILCIEFDNIEMDKNTFQKLYDSYGEDKLNSFFSDMIEFNNNDQEFVNIYRNINSSIDFLNNMYDDENDIDSNKKAAYEEELANINMDDTIRLYLREIGQINLLTPEEEKELATRAKYGDEDAKNKLIEANLRLVVSVAKRHIGKGIPFLDLIQDGNTGLITAVNKFDVDRGNRITTYATWWIRQAITRSLADHGEIIRVPVHMSELINKITFVQRMLTIQLDKEPTEEEIAEKLNLPVEKVKEAISYKHEFVSLYSPVTEGENTLLLDMIQDPNTSVEKECDKRALPKVIDEVFETLTEREVTVLKMRFGMLDGSTHTLEEVGKLYGLTRERIRQIENKALRKLRHPTRARKLKMYY